MLPIFAATVSTDEIYMQRCLQLAELGQGSVEPNPLVGAVLVFGDKVIGEGFHQKYGAAHAEVNCINSVTPDNRKSISQSTLYVSLEPCAHFGKTPPCTDLIIREKISRVVIGCRDPFSEVNGKGIEKLKSHGIEVEEGVLADASMAINKKFFHFHALHRPFITLKWAETDDKKIAGNSSERVFISNQFTNRLVHKWRTEYMSILVGLQTAMKDDPELTARYWPGKNPLRLVIDAELQLPQHLKLFNDAAPTLVFNFIKHTIPENCSFKNLDRGIFYYQVGSDASMVHQIVHALYQMEVQSVLVEGGAYTLQSFIDEGVWDEAVIITNNDLIIPDGLPAPQLKGHKLHHSQNLFSDNIRYYVPDGKTAYA